jgi:hypothetical protein
MADDRPSRLSTRALDWRFFPIGHLALQVTTRGNFVWEIKFRQSSFCFTRRGYCDVTV